MDVKLVPSRDLDLLLAKVSEISEKVDAISRRNRIPTILSTGDVCELLHLSSRTVQRYRDQGLIHFIQVGRKICYTSDSLNEFMKSHHIKRGDS